MGQSKRVGVLAALAIAICAAAPELTWDDAIARGQRLQELGRYPEAKGAFEGAMKQAEAFPPQDPRRAITLANLASVCQDLGEAGLARENYERAIAGFERSHGKGHPVLAKPLHNLAALYVEQGQFAKAERLRRRALALHADGVEVSDADRLMIRQGLAAALLGEGRTIEAEEMYRQILAELESRAAPPVRQINPLRNDLAVLCAQMGRWDEALAQLLKAVATGEQVFGPEHPELLKPLSNLAAVYSMMGRNRDAEPVFRRALAIASRSLGETDAYGRILWTYAAVLRKLHRNAEGKEAEKRAAAILSAFGRDASLRYSVDVGDLVGPPPRPR
jgi:tetratricopeptide (TPR) repeat protein